MGSLLRRFELDRRVVWAICSLIVIGLATWGLLKYLSSIPGPTERKFISAFEERDWGKVHDLAPSPLLDGHGISRDQFVTFMGSVTEGLPDSYFQAVTYEVLSAENIDRHRGFHGLLLTFPGAPKVDGEPFQHFLHAMRGPNGWKIAVNELPIRFLNLRPGDRKDRWRIFADSMEKAGISEYWTTLNGPVLRRDRIRWYLAGQIEESALYTHK